MYHLPWKPRGKLGSGGGNLLENRRNWVNTCHHREQCYPRFPPNFMIYSEYARILAYFHRLEQSVETAIFHLRNCVFNPSILAQYSPGTVRGIGGENMENLDESPQKPSKVHAKTVLNAPVNKQPTHATYAGRKAPLFKSQIRFDICCHTFPHIILC